MKLTTLLNNALNQSKPLSLTKLRRKAAKRGWTIEIDRVGRDIGYWIDGTGLEDGTFCASKEELDYTLDTL
jgi:hypothetical protein